MDKDCHLVVIEPDNSSHDVKVEGNQVCYSLLSNPCISKSMENLTACVPKFLCIREMWLFIALMYILLNHVCKQIVLKE